MLHTRSQVNADHDNASRSTTCIAQPGRENKRMKQSHHFHLSANWPGGRNGVGELTCGRLQTQVSIDRCMNGPGIGTNPDELFLGAAGMCYFMTLAAMIERAELPITTMSLQSDMCVETGKNGFECREIVHQPCVTLAAAADATAMRTLTRLVGAADRSCMISKAVRGNVKVVLRPQLNRAGV